MLKPSQGLTTVPEGTLVNLDESYPSTPPPATRDQPKRRPGFAKRPGGSGKGNLPHQQNGNGAGADVDEGAGAESENDDDWEEEEWVPDVFLFEYGTVVIWGMTEREEKTFLRMLWVVCCWRYADPYRKKFEVERLSSEDIEREDLNFYYADYSR
jgi:hypothetical protein